MKKFFKNIFKKIGSDLINSAKDHTVSIMKNEIAPYAAQQALIQSKLLLYKQMNNLLNSIKSYLLELKVKTRATTIVQDDHAYDYGLSLLKDFSRSVIETIDEIEKY